MWKKIFATITILMILVGFFPAVNTTAYDPGYYITNYKIDVKIQEDGIYVIEENIDVVFTESSRGIFRYIPTKYSRSWDVDGQSYYRNYEFPVSNIKVSGHESEIDYRSYDVMIRIGDPDRWLSGEQHYKIQYQMHTKELDVPGLGDQFYLNLIGSEWDTEINHVDINVTFPKAVDLSLWSVTSGSKGNTSNEHMSCEVVQDGLSMHCSSYAGLNANESVTILQPLGEGYYKFPDFALPYLAVLGGSIVMLLVTVFIFFRYGKDDKVIETVEFSAPKGLNSASVGYIIDNVVHTRDVMSLILEWAKDNYIHIKEEDGDLTLTKIKELSEDKSKPAYEISMFNQVFKKGDEIKIASLKYKFADQITKVQQGVMNFFKKKERQLYTSKSKSYKVLVMLLAAIPLALNVGISVYSKIYRLSMALLVTAIVYVVATLIAAALIYGLRNMRGKKVNFTGIFIGLILFFNFGTLFLGMAVDGIAQNMSIYLIASLLVYAAMVFLGIFMDKRTEYGNRVYGQVLGLKDFIKTAEEDRLKVLAKENPYIFYDILPYAYAFNLTDVWAKHFKNLEVPEPEFYSSTAYVPFAPRIFVGSLNTSLAKATRTMTSVPPSTSSSGGGSFSGGGGGGFSGGGSSGGGFGGGGGGRW